MKSYKLDDYNERLVRLHAALAELDNAKSDMHRLISTMSQDTRMSLEKFGVEIPPEGSEDYTVDRYIDDLLA